jgi:enamine deaminase RidA (YjgF/YER057c/UK114 family)
MLTYNIKWFYILLYLEKKIIYMNFMSPPYSSILDNLLYVGGKTGMHQDIKFDLIVNCTPNLPCPNYCKNCIRIPVNNSKKDCNKFFNIITKTDVLEQIHTTIQNKKTVLVHCMEGMHRSCSLTACYLMKYKNMNVKDAMAFVKNKRSVAFNQGV